MTSEIVPYKDIEQMAAQVVKSKMFAGINTPEAAVTLMLLCQSEGLHPMQALTRYHLINNKPAMKADAMLAEFMRRGGTVKWIEWTNEACEAEFRSSGCPEGVKVRWTIEDARRAGVTGNPTWSKYPRQMLKARVSSDGVRMADPVVNQGRYTPEEIRDIQEDDKPKQAEFEVVGDAPFADSPVGVAPLAAPTTVQSATGQTTEEHLAEAKAKRAEALKMYAPMNVAPPPNGVALKCEKCGEPLTSERIKSGNTRFCHVCAADRILTGEADAEVRAARDARRPPVEPFDAERISKAVAKKYGRPTSVPDWCTCGEPVMKYQSSDGSREYWECDWRHRERHKAKEAGETTAKIGELFPTKGEHAHFFKDAGKVTQTTEG